MLFVAAPNATKLSLAQSVRTGFTLWPSTTVRTKGGRAMMPELLIATGTFIVFVGCILDLLV